MSYKTGETAIYDLIVTFPNFGHTNTSQSNWKVLNSGKSDHYAILRPGTFSTEWHTLSAYTAIYETIVEVWQRYKNEIDSKTDLYTYANELMAELMPYQHLNSTFSDATIRGGEEPEEMWSESGGPAWLKWELIIEWREESGAVTFQD